eukprot:CCRYP_001200-RA/>CCRYP_001200-RA protein AED:0.69 eAED:0.75 QI:0/0/0/1/0/0/3/0/405
MTYQLVPPGDHRITSLPSSVAQALNFPSTFGANYYHKWSANSVFYGNQCIPHISSHTHLYHHDYNAHPFVPWAWKPFDKPHRRKSFAQHCTKGYVIGTSRALPLLESMDTNSRTTRISATVFFKHKYITNPSVTPAERNHSRCKPISSTHKQSPGPSQQQSQPIRSHPTTNPNTTITSPQHNATHYQQHSPNATHPSSPAAVSDYESDSSDSANESITIPHPVPGCLCNLQGVTTTNQDTTSKGSRTYNHTGNHPTPAPQHRTPLTPRSAATRQFPRDALSAILDTDTGELLEYRHLIKTQSTAPYGKMHMAKNSVASPKVSRHCQRHQHYSLHCVTKSLRSVVRMSPRDIVANYRPRRKTLIAFDSQLAVTGSLTLATAAAPTADMLTTKILLNSVISTKEHGS